MTKTFEEELKEAYERVSINLYGNIAGSIGMKKLLNELAWILTKVLSWLTPTTQQGG